MGCDARRAGCTVPTFLPPSLPVNPAAGGDEDNILGFPPSRLAVSILQRAGKWVQSAGLPLEAHYCFMEVTLT